MRRLIWEIILGLLILLVIYHFTEPMPVDNSYGVNIFERARK